MASVLAFVIMGLFWLMVFAMDYLKFFVMKDKRVKETKKKYDWSNLKRRGDQIKSKNTQKKGQVDSLYDKNTNNRSLEKFQQLKKKCLTHEP